MSCSKRFNCINNHILDPPGNLEIDNIKEEYAVGEQISCSADGYPEPTIYWISGNTTVNKPTLNITADMIGPQSFTCVAWNEILGDVHEVSITLDFTVKQSGKST